MFHVLYPNSTKVTSTSAYRAGLANPQSARPHRTTPFREAGPNVVICDNMDHLWRRPKCFLFDVFFKVTFMEWVHQIESVFLTGIWALRRDQN